MREFFRKELNTLKAKTGLNQYENFSGMKGPDGESIAGEQIAALLDGLAWASDQYPYIPEEDKKKIISDSIITDQEFTGLYGRTVHKWLSPHRNRYFKEEAHQPGKLIAEPVTEQEREVWLKRWEEDLQGRENNFSMPKLSPNEIKKEGQEEERTLKAELDKLAPKQTGYIPPSAEWIAMQSRIKHIAGNIYKDLPINGFRNFGNFVVEGFEIYCESKEKAQEIFIEAITEKE